MRVFGWCTSGKHDECIREYQHFYIDTKTGKPVYTGAVVVCDCKHKGCLCNKEKK